MREVLFRGRRLDSGEWVYGSFWQWPDGDCVIVTFMDIIDWKTALNRT